MKEAMISEADPDDHLLAFEYCIFDLGLALVANMELIFLLCTVISYSRFQL